MSPERNPIRPLIDYLDNDNRLVVDEATVNFAKENPKDPRDQEGRILTNQDLQKRQERSNIPLP